MLTGRLSPGRQSRLVARAWLPPAEHVGAAVPGVVVSHFHPRKGQREWQHKDFPSRVWSSRALRWLSTLSRCSPSASTQSVCPRRAIAILAPPGRTLSSSGTAACCARLLPSAPTDSAAEREVRMRSVAIFAQDLAVLQAPGLATKVLQHAKASTWTRRRPHRCSSCSSPSRAG